MYLITGMLYNREILSLADNQTERLNLPEIISSCRKQKVLFVKQRLRGALLAS